MSLLSAIFYPRQLAQFYQWGRDLGRKPDYIVQMEARMWTMILGIANGQDASDALEWLVTFCSHEMHSLQANLDDVYAFFANGRMSDKDSDPQVAAPGHVEYAHANNAPPQGPDPPNEMTMDMDLSNALGTFDPPVATSENDSASMEGIEEARSSSPPPHITPRPSSPILGHQTGSLADIEAAVASATAGQLTPRPSSPNMPLQTGSLAEIETIVSSSPARRPTSPLILPDQPTDPFNEDPGSPLSILTSSDDDAEDDEPAIELATQAVSQLGKKSSRVVKPPPMFTSGATLTRAPAKKRKLETDASTPLPIPEVTTKREDLFWESAVTYVTAAVSQLTNLHLLRDHDLTFGTGI